MRYCVLKGAKEPTVSSTFVRACKKHNRDFETVRQFMSNRFRHDILEEISEEESIERKKSGYSKCFVIEKDNRISKSSL